MMKIQGGTVDGCCRLGAMLETLGREGCDCVTICRALYRLAVSELCRRARVRVAFGDTGRIVYLVKLAVKSISFRLVCFYRLLGSLFWLDNCQFWGRDLWFDYRMCPLSRMPLFWGGRTWRYMQSLQGCARRRMFRCRVGGCTESPADYCAD